MNNTKYYKELIIYYSNNLFPIVINIEKKRTTTFKQSNLLGIGNSNDSLSSHFFIQLIITTDISLRSIGCNKGFKNNQYILPFP